MEPPRGHDHDRDRRERADHGDVGDRRVLDGGEPHADVGGEEHAAERAGAEHRPGQTPARHQHRDA
jgi:hypothetical protein